jgi:hypothetical protein
MLLLFNNTHILTNNMETLQFQDYNYSGFFSHKIIYACKLIRRAVCRIRANRSTHFNKDSVAVTDLLEKWMLKEIWHDDFDRILLRKDRLQWRTVVNVVL